MKLPNIQMLYAIVLSGAVGMVYADEGKDESREGRERGKYTS